MNTVHFIAGAFAAGLFVSMGIATGIWATETVGRTLRSIGRLVSFWWKTR